MFKRRRAEALVGRILSGTGDTQRAAIRLRALGVAGFDITARALAVAEAASVKRDLAWAFCGYGPSALDNYVRALSDPSPEVRAQAALGIQYQADRGGSRAIPALLPLLADADPAVAQRAVWALEAYGPETVPLLQRVRAHGPGRQRPRALQALVELAGEDGLSAADRSAVDRLIGIKLLAERPGPFTPHSGWLAVPGGDQAGIVAALELSDPRPATMVMGLDVVQCAAYPSRFGVDRPALSRVFLTPELAGWTLVIGDWLTPELPVRREAVAAHCVRLSDRYGAAHAYGWDADSWESAWLIAERGEIVRYFIPEDTSIGEPLPVEREFLPYGEWAEACEAAESPDQQPPRCTALDVAGAMSVNPERFGPDTPMRGHGLLALTPYGAEHGVPHVAPRI